MAIQSIIAPSLLFTFIFYSSLRWFSHPVWLVTEIDRWLFGTDTDISAIHGLIPITDISKIFKSCILLHYQKYYNVLCALSFFKNFQNQDL